MDSITGIIFLPLPPICIIGFSNRFIWQKPSRLSVDGWADRLLGDPEGWPHPVVGFGKVFP